MSADAALRAAQAIHDTCPSTDCYDLSQDAANCEACTEQGRAAVIAARPIIEAEALDRAGKEAAFGGGAEAAEWLHRCAQGIRHGGWEHWLSETDHGDERPVSATTTISPR